MKHADCIGRVGALAVALGVGAAISGWPGAAWGAAADAESSASSPSDSSPQSADSPTAGESAAAATAGSPDSATAGPSSDTTEDPDPAVDDSPSSGTTEDPAPPGDAVPSPKDDESAGVHTPTADPDNSDDETGDVAPMLESKKQKQQELSKPKRTPRRHVPDPESAADTAPTEPTQPAVRTQPQRGTAPSVSSPVSAPPTEQPARVVSAPVVVAVSTPVTEMIVSQPVTTVAEPTTEVQLVSSLLSGLTGSTNDGNDPPVPESPAALAVAAWTRSRMAQGEPAQRAVTPKVQASTSQASTGGQVAPLAAAAAVVSSPAFVQANSATPQSNQSSVGVGFGGVQAAGDTNIVVIGWGDVTSNIAAVTDSVGNVYRVAVATARGSGVSQAIYYASDIKAAGAGVNTVTVRFDRSTPAVDVRVLEYSGLDRTNPFQVGRSASGSAWFWSDSGTVSAGGGAGSLVFGAGTTRGDFSGAGSGFTSRILTVAGDIAEDRVVTGAGSYGATAWVSGAWVMQVAAFKVADRTAPSVSVTTGSGSVSGTVSLAASASDNVGVAGVQFLVNGAAVGAEDTASPYGVSWNTASVANGVYAVTARARDAAGNTTTSAPVNLTVANDLTAPTVSLTSPVAGPVRGAVTLSATASDNVGVAGVQFLVDGAPFAAEDTVAPYTLTVATTAADNGVHTVAARVRDAAGNTTTTPAVSVTVDNTAPTVSLTAPTNGSTVSGTVSIGATASDNVGVAGVQFLVNGAAVGVEDLTSPFGVSWNTASVANGVYAVTARARDAAGNTTTSAPVNLTVANDLTAPTVSLTSPVGTVSGTVTVGATASDNVGVAGVQFLVDGVAVGSEDTTSPYGVSWNTASVGNGVHTLAARARDAAGNTATSPPVSVTVANGVAAGVTPIAVGSHPIDEVVAGNRLYVVNSGDGSVSVIDTTTNQVVNTIAGLGYATPMVASADGRYLYVGQYDSYYVTASVAVVDTVTRSVVATVTMPKCETECYANSAGITDIAISPDNSRVYVSELWGGDSFYAGTITMVDTATRTVVGYTGNSQPTDFYSNIEVSPDGTRLYAGSGYAYYPQMDVFDAHTLVGVDTVPLDGNPGYPPLSMASLTFSPDGKRAYARTTLYWPDQPSQTFAVIDTDPASATYNTQIATITAPPGAQYLKVSADNSRAYVVHNGGQTVTVVDTATNTVIGSVPSNQVGGDYAALAIGPNGTLYFSNYANNAVYAVTPGTLTTTAALVTAESLSAPTTFRAASNAPAAATTTSAPMVLSSIAVAPAPQRLAAGVQPLAVAAAVADTTAPAVSLIAPANGGSVKGAVTLTANASDNVGIAGVQFFANGSPLSAEDTAAPYSITVATTAANNGTYTLTARARDAAGNTTTSAPVSVTVDNTAPTVSLTGPVNGATVKGAVTLSANASDNRAVAGVQFLVDGVAAGAEDTSSPWSVVFNTATVSNGAHTLTARARDAAGNTTTSAPITITVDNTAPTVSLTGPANGATVKGAVTLSANASDNRAVAGVQFLVDGVAMGAEDTSSPWSAAFNTTTVSNGTHTLAARARDAAGNTTTSAGVNVAVNNADVTAPSVSVSAPSGNLSGTVNLSATATDNVGVAGVQFLVNGNAVGAEDTSSPYGVSWNTTTVANGTYAVTARARDAAGNTTTSAPVNLTVANGNAPTNYVVTPVTVGTGPSGVALANGFTYVINYDGNDVTVINTATNQLVTSVDVGQGPLSVAASEQSKRVYVSNSLDNSVSIIDANDNTVVDTIQIAVPQGVVENPEAGPLVYVNKVTELAVNPTGTRLYVNATDGSLRVFDTGNNNAVISTTYPGRFNDVKVSPDGTRLYGTPGVGLTVIDTATMTAVGVQVGPVWDHFALQSAFTDSVGNIAVSPDGKRVYVTYSATTVATATGGHTSGSFITDSYGISWMITGGSGGVSVVDTDPASATYNKEITRVAVPNWAQDLVASGGRLYVTDWDDMSVTVIDTTTNTIVGSFTTDQTRSAGRNLWVYGYYEWYPEWQEGVFGIAAFNRYITAGPDGTVYVTDYGNGAVYVVTPGSPVV